LLKQRRYSPLESSILIFMIATGVWWGDTASSIPSSKQVAFFRSLESKLRRTNIRTFDVHLKISKKFFLKVLNDFLFLKN
jgi:hypothetical protein